ncbi:hypothetical protein BDV11DRAFT_96901 [Aspergillus similis]
MLHTECLVMSLLRRIRAHRATGKFRSLLTDLSGQRARQPDTDLSRLLRQCVLHLTVLTCHAWSFRYCSEHTHEHFSVGLDPLAASSSLHSKAYGVFLNSTIKLLETGPTLWQTPVSMSR